MSCFFQKVSIFIKRKYQFVFRKKNIALMEGVNFVIISNSCWGGAIYQWLKKPYNTPFVGLGIEPNDYLKLLSKFDYYMEFPLKFQTPVESINNENNYPIGFINDIKIHFTHYKTEEEAKEKWTKRTKRMLELTNKDQYFFMISDSRKATKNHFKEFHELPYRNKISFTIYDYSDLHLENHHKVNERDKKIKNHIPNAVKLFKITFLYLDLFQWIKNNSLNKSV